MKCIRVHRARRVAHAAYGVGVALTVAASGRAAVAQQPPYPPPPYPSYPPAPQYPQHPSSPPYPSTPQYPYPQPGTPGQQTPAALPPYRLPVLSVAQPAEGVVLPDDKPVAVFRFASAEPLDPIDALSFSVTVDGIDRTALFTLTNGEAWGRLAPADELLAAGQHEVRARVCSARGACATAKATVTVVARESLLQGAVVAADRSGAAKSQRRRRILDAVLQAARVLIRQ